MSEDETRPTGPTWVEMPKPTVAPLVLALGIVLAAAGAASSVVLILVGGLLFVVGLGLWVRSLLPAEGHWHEPLVEPQRRPKPVIPAASAVQRLREGMPGYRFRLPEKVHPISAGVKGGVVGGLVMPVPAMVYGVLSGHGIWLPINLLAGMVLPGIGELSPAELDRFNPTLLALGACIHVAVSLILGLMYGVLLPALPAIPKPVAWGSLLMPLLWTGIGFIAMGAVSPLTRSRVEWPWFIASQFIFGLVAAIVFMGASKGRSAILAGLFAGAGGGLLMPIPAVLWGWLSGHGIWYPVNLLSGMLVRHSSDMTLPHLEQFHGQWLAEAVVMHAILSLSFGLAFGLVLPRVPPIPGPVAWGSLVMPLLWMAMSYSLMGIVNPVLQKQVDWPWFVVSQFVFGLVASIVVVRSEMVPIPPAGRGPNDMSVYETR